MDFNSSFGMISDFEESAVWQDLKKMFGAWLVDIQIKLEDFDGNTPEYVLRRLQGNAQTLRRVMDAPKWLVANIEGKEIEHGN